LSPTSARLSRSFLLVGRPEDALFDIERDIGALAPAAPASEFPGVDAGRALDLGRNRTVLVEIVDRHARLTRLAKQSIDFAAADRRAAGRVLARRIEDVGLRRAA
jgi:hypothetical protein